MRRPLTFLALALLLSSCGDGEGGDQPYIGLFVNGQLWAAEAQEGIVVYPVDSPDGAGTIFTIASKMVGGGSQFITLNLPIPPVIGSYALDGSAVSATYASCPNGYVEDCIYWTAVGEHPGTLTIDDVDSATRRIEGHFSLTGYASGDPEGGGIGLTSGRFRIFAPGAFMTD